MEGSVPPGLKEIEGLEKFEGVVSIYFVYFLCDGDEVVYIGQTFLLSKRIEAHKENKIFTDVYYIKVSTIEDALRFESYYIVRLNPKYNKTHCAPLPEKKENLSIGEYLKKNGITFEQAAAEAGLSAQTIYLHATGRSLPGAKALRAYHKAFGISLEKLVD